MVDVDDKSMSSQTGKHTDWYVFCRKSGVKSRKWRDCPLKEFLYTKKMAIWDFVIIMKLKIILLPNDSMYNVYNFISFSLPKQSHRDRVSHTL